MFRIDLRAGESVRVGDCVITIEKKSGAKARLAIDAERSVSIQRMPEPVQQPQSSAETVRPRPDRIAR